MTEPIKPALTPEEWLFFAETGHVKMPETRSTLAVVRMTTEARHVAAAAALHGQPFGFTHADVDALNDALGSVNSDRDTYDVWDEDVRVVLRSLADRLTALLPPREP